MARLSQWVADAGIDRPWVATGGPAVGFYRRCGFTVAEVALLRNGDRPTVLTESVAAG